MRASGNCKEVLVGDGRGEGKKAMPSNTTRGTGNAIADRGRVWNASNGIVPPTATFYSTSALSRSGVSACVAAESGYAGPRRRRTMGGRDKRPVLRIIDQFRADSQPWRSYSPRRGSCSSPATKDLGVSVEKSMAGNSRRYCCAPGKKDFRRQQRASIKHWLA